MINLTDAWNFNELLKNFLNTPVLYNNIHLDPEQMKNHKQELQNKLWYFFTTHINDIGFRDCRYSGRVIRVLNCRKSRVEFDGIVTHWSCDIHSFVKQAKGFDFTKRYTWISASIKDGFNVNQYYIYHNPHCEFECEVLYPMEESVVSDMFYGTYEEFQKHNERRTYEN